MTSPATRRRFRRPGRALFVTVVYAVLASVWIYASDALLGVIITDPALFATASMYKGWIFVAVTSALLFGLLRTTPGEVEPPAASGGGFRIWPPLVIFAAFAIAVGTVGFLVFRGIEHTVREKAEDTLSAVANLKSRQIADWLTERRANVERESGSQFMAAQAAVWLERGTPEDGDRLRNRLSGIAQTQGWSSVALVDLQGRPSIVLGARYEAGTEDRKLLEEAARTGRTLVRDLHRGPGQSVRLTFIAPLMLRDATGVRPVAALVMTIDARRQLYPLVADWPLPSASGESVLIRRDGDSFVVLTELRHRRGSALQLRLPITDERLVGARALRGERQPIEGIDYRGVPVLASVGVIPGSPWMLVTKIDLREVNGPIADSARLVALFGIVLVLAAGLATAFWLRQQRATAAVRHYRAERERVALTRQLDILTRHANDIILLVDDKGKILDANERAVAAYGRSREELIGSSASSVRAPESLDSFELEWDRALRQEGVVFETMHRRSDGTKFPVEVSTRAINIEGNVLRQSIVRDITERKDADRKIRRLTSIYAALTQINQAIVRGTTRGELFDELCRVTVEFAQLDFAWVGLVDEAKIVRPAASRGGAGDYLDGVEFSLDESLPSSRGPIAIAIRERRTYVCSDIRTDPGTLTWRDRAERAGFRAIAAFPLTCDGRAIAALAVYARDTSYFDEQTIALLEEMTHDVSFALDSIASDERRAAAEAALRESEEKYRLLFSNEQDAIVIFDAETTRIVEANDAFLALSGYTQEQARTLTVFDVSGEHEATKVSVATVRERGSERVRARRLRRRDGSELWVELGMNAFVWRGRTLVAAILRDITERKEGEERSLLWANLLENSAEGIVITDAQQRILHVNRAFTELTGYEPVEVIGTFPRLLASGRYDDDFYRSLMRTVRESGRWQGEIWNRRRNGDLFPGWLSITAVRNAVGEISHYVGIFSDITERKEAAERINFLSNHDALTALPNRSVMNDLVQQSLAIARRKGAVLALLFLDLDRFKTINDSLGHPVGDSLLQEIARRLSATVREEDNVARLGGDEFLILLPELGRGRDAAVVAEKILVAVREPLVVEGRTLRVTGSIGISLFPDDGADVPTLIKNADAAMYHAKERGRNNYQFFTSDMNARAFEALAMEMSLRGAVQRDEFTLLYQPQIEAVTGTIVAAEALIRWHHPELGLISPSGFIPIAEEHGLIVPIGEWVLRTACMQIRSWIDAGLEVVPIAVNVSAVQFRQAGLAARVRAILDETGVEPRFLELELTESIIMRDAEQTIAVLEELSDMGVSLAIDDFGTGYSSLSYLRRFPIHRLKIDQSFVRDIPSSSDAAAIATAIIGMGRSMKLRVIAEGVETAEQLEFLTAERCDELQGFHIARPMEAADLSSLLREGRPLKEMRRV